LIMAWRMSGFAYAAAFRDRVVISRSVLEGTGTLAFVAALPFITLGQSVVIVANPFGGKFNVYLLLAQFTAVTWAIRDLITSRIVGRIPSIAVALINTVVVGLLAVPGALWQHWRGFGEQEALYLLGSGCLVAIANFLYIDALRTGAISIVAPFRYTAALWASIAGFLIWGDVPDSWGLLGTLFIIGSGLYT